MNIDPEAPPEEESKFGFQLPQIEPGMQNSDYVSLMAQIEAKEKELAEKEKEAMHEAYEHIELTEENQAAAEARKKELQKMLASMQEFDSEFDELDKELDDKLSSLLRPDLEGFDDNIDAVLA